MSVDLRTQLNSCDSITGVQGDGPVDVDNTAGFVYHGTNAWTTQHTNTDEHIRGPVDGGSADLSDATCYLILKDNLVQTAALGGVQYLLGVTNNRIGYGMGGNDDVGMPLDVFWNSFKLDVSERANAPYSNVYQGNEGSINFAAITEVGLGTVHLAKAQGNVDNIKVDRMSFHVNGSYAIRINGGTSGTPETMSDVVGDSITNGWGLFANPTGAQYSFHGPTEWGEPTSGSSYFEASNEQWTWFGGSVGATHFPFRVVGNAGGTNSFVLDAVSITNVGTRAEFDMSDANIDILDLNAVNFTDLGAITFPPALAAPNELDRILNNVVFNNCDQVYFDDIPATFVTFNGTNSTEAAMEIDVVGHEADQTDFTFNRIGDVPAIVIRTPGTYTLTRWNFNGYDGTPGSNLTPNSGPTAAAIYNLSGGAVTINISGGNTPTVRNGAGATTTISNPETITFTGIPNGLEGRVRRGSVSLFHEQSITGNTFVYPHNGETGFVTVTIGGVADDTLAYERQTLQVELGNGNLTIPLSFELNPSYS